MVIPLDLDNRIWTTGFGPLDLDHRTWTIGFGPPDLDHRIWSREPNQREMLFAMVHMVKKYHFRKSVDFELSEEPNNALRLQNNGPSKS